MTILVYRKKITRVLIIFESRQVESLIILLFFFVMLQLLGLDYMFIIKTKMNYFPVEKTKVTYKVICYKKREKKNEQSKVLKLSQYLKLFSLIS